MTAVDKIAARAATVKPLRALLTILVAPLYAVGFLVALLFVACAWLFAAAVEGFEAGRSMRSGSSE